MKLLILLLLAAVPVWAYVTPQDTVIIDGRIARTWTQPLQSFPWPKGRPALSEHPMEGVIVSDSNGVRLIWEIRDAQLYLIAADGYMFGPDAPDRSIGIADLMPERIENGRVFANWFSGEFVVFEIGRIKPARRPAKNASEPFIRLTRKFTIHEGRIVTELQELFVK